MNLYPDLREKTIIAMNRLLQNNSYLQKVGWFNSFFSQLPLDRQGKALPWYTYSAIAFLEDKVRKNMFVFEYGSGTSTIWWSDHATKVVSCEHDKKWYQKLKPIVAVNVDYIFFDLIPGGNYSRAVKQYNDEFDIVVIDGRDRVNCVKDSLYSLKHDGVIVWDNSDRKEYKEGYTYLLANGFKRLDFWGLGPMNAHGWCTSVFYRPNNCFGI
jgi:hypothetical protein